MEEKQHYRCVIFDFDGTLADSMPFLQKIGVEIMMKHFGVSKKDATEMYVSTTGLPYEDDPKDETAIEEFEQLKIERIYEQELFPDAESTVRELLEMRFPVFVSSSTFQPTIEEYFRRKGILDLFKAIVGYRPGFEKGPDHFRHISSTYNIPIGDMVFVGDSLKDYERSKGFCDFIAVFRMFDSQRFREAGHRGSGISNLAELPKIISHSD
ncbi:MAG: HAD family hydrolase [Candidatus Thorarchaeota archaeon]|jgi:HAD superfamily hydrolase (TIGR01549 family)